MARDEHQQEYEVEIGRQIGSRLARAARDRGWTQGEVHMHANAGKQQPIVSKATVSALLRGSIANPGFATVLPVAQALGVSLDQLLGLAPMPTYPAPVENDVVARVARLEEILRQALPQAAREKLAAAEAAEQVLSTEQPTVGKPKRKS